MSLSTRIFIGLILGILTGLFFGELVADWKVVGDLFVQLLQITVLPYIVVSLIAGFAKMRIDQVSTLAVRGGLILLAIWLITLIMVYLSALSFPPLENESFFSSPTPSDRTGVDLFELFVPANVFYSLGHSMVPAVVLFSLLVGIGLISVTDKEIVIRVFDALGAALTRINDFVVKLTPYGIFFIASSAAGTLTLDELARVQVYLVTYICLAAIVTFWVFPALISSLSGIPYRDILGTFKDALVTAFATGNQFVVLPLIAENCKQILRKHNVSGDEADAAIDVIVPISFNFPSLGKLLVLLFIMFAGWFTSTDMSPGDYLVLSVNGIQPVWKYPRCRALPPGTVGNTDRYVPVVLDYRCCCRQVWRNAGRLTHNLYRVAWYAGADGQAQVRSACVDDLPAWNAGIGHAGRCFASGILSGVSTRAARQTGDDDQGNTDG